MALTKISHDDNDKAVFGTSEDLKIYHDGSHSYIDETGTGGLSIRTGDLYLRNPSNADFIYCQSGGFVKLYHNGNLKLETTSTGVTVTGSLVTSGNIDLADSSGGGNNRALFGTGEDLQIYHSGTHSFINHEGTGHLIINGSTTNNVDIMKGGHSEYMARFIPDAAVELYYDNVRKFRTTAEGAMVDGSFYIKDSEHLILNDTNKAKFGNGGDLQIYHDGSHSYIYSDNGELKNRAAIWKVVNEANSEVQIKATENGSVELYYDNAKKLETTSEGIRLGDSVKAEFGDGDDLQLFHNGTENKIYSNAGNLDLVAQNGTTAIRVHTDATVDIGFGADDVPLRFGAGSDLKIYHDNWNSFVKHTGTSLGNLYIDSVDADVVLRSGDGSGSVHTAVNCKENGAVELYYDNVKKIETTTYGQRTTGYHTSSAHPIASLSHNGNSDISDDVLDSGNFYGHEMVNQGSHFDDSNGRFTCPVAGVYRVFARFTVDSEDTNVRLRKNGTAVAEVYSGDISTQSFSVSGEMVVSCAANDYLDLQAHRLKVISGTQHKQVTFQLIA